MVKVSGEQGSGQVHSAEVCRVEGPQGKSSTMEWHPHAGDLFSLSTDKSIDIYALENGSLASVPQISLSTESEISKQHYWTPLTGSRLFSHSTKNVISTYDPRSSSLPTTLLSSLNLLPNRPSVSTLLDDTTLLVTGTSSITRNPLLQIFDLRTTPTLPTHTIDFPSSSPSSTLIPLCDPHRRTAYLLQTQSSSIYSLDLNAPAPTPTGARLTTTIIGGGLLPPWEVDVMRAEINRIYVAGSAGEIGAVGVRVERRSYLDFHEDLFPEVFGPGTGGSGREWLEGKDTVREMVSLDPEKQGWRTKLVMGAKEQIPPTIAGTQEERKEVNPSTERTEIPMTTTIPANDDTSSPSTATPISTIPPQTSSLPTTASLPQSQPPSSQPIPSTPTPSTTPISPNYTRKFLTGTLHHPSKHYTSLPPPPTTSLHRTLTSTSTHIAYPLSGPGGRLAMIPLSSPGRQSSPATISNGSSLVDFSLSPFDQEVLCAGEDGKVRICSFEVQERGVLGGVEKVIQVEWNPVVRGVVGVLCVDIGRCEFRVWDVQNSQTKRAELGYMV